MVGLACTERNMEYSISSQQNAEKQGEGNRRTRRVEGVRPEVAYRGDVLEPILLRVVQHVVEPDVRVPDVRLHLRERVSSMRTLGCRLDG